MRVLRSPVTQFLIVGLLTVTGIALGINFFAGQAASDEAIQEARGTNEVLARSVVMPDLTPGLVDLNFGAVDRFDRRILPRLRVGPVRHFNLLTSDGTIVYSDDKKLIGRKAQLSDDQRRIIAVGGTGSRFATARTVHTGGEARSADAAEMAHMYTRIRAPEGDPLLFEAYYSLDGIESRRQEIFASFRWITLGPLILLIAIVTLMLRFLSGQLTRAGHERERLLKSAIDASEAERRRIARDLHDGVVQDLAGTAFSISAIARDPETSPDSRTTLKGAGGALRDSLKALRSLVAEIHPPELHSEGLAAALADLIAPAGPARIQASVSVAGVDSASTETTALVWRVAQEAVRNAIRHSRASTLAVTVRGDGGRVSLEVVDDGIGFTPGLVQDPDSYGLRGLKTLVADCGGELGVRSSPGEGTTVRMEVDAQ